MFGRIAVTDISYPVRVRVAIAALVILILVASLRQLSLSVAHFRASIQANDISQYEKRFIGVKDFLPAGQIVPYCDDLAEVRGQCDALVLAQYALAPTVLSVQNSSCGQISALAAQSALSSRVWLKNSHNPQAEPYLLKLFPSSYFGEQNHERTSAQCEVAASNRLALLKTFGPGVSLYGQDEK